VRYDPPLASSAARYPRPQHDAMSNDEPDEDRSDWSFLRFLRSVLSEKPDFHRLLALVVVLMLGVIVLLALVDVALDKINVIALYGHLTQHASVWESGGVTSGGISFFFGAWKGFAYLKAKKKAKRKAKKQAKKKAKKALPGSGGTGETEAK
jgi:hypothetical protein